MRFEHGLHGLTVPSPGSARVHGKPDHLPGLPDVPGNTPFVSQFLYDHQPPASQVAGFGVPENRQTTTKVPDFDPDQTTPISHGAVEIETDCSDQRVVAFPYVVLRVTPKPEP